MSKRAGTGASALAAAPKRPQPAWISPMLATLTHDVFSAEGWIFEPKFDGERCLAFRNGDSLRLLSRNRQPLDGAYPELIPALRDQRSRSFIIDGEVVAFEGERTSFERLQQRMQIRDPEQARRTGVPVFYYVFDLLYLNGYETTRLPLRERKKLLAESFEFRDPLRFTEHRQTEGEAFHREACKHCWEGLIAKRADSIYVSVRSRDWLKFKCVNEQEFVIGGYTDPQGSRTGFGALLAGYYEGGRLRYAGKIGTGFTDEILRRLGRELRSIQRSSSPFPDAVVPRKGVHWVEPKLVAQIGFTEWTRDGKLRHPRFLGLRDDKPAREVVRE